MSVTDTERTNRQQYFSRPAGIRAKKKSDCFNISGVSIEFGRIFLQL